jgi:hypothetical protein
MESAARAGEMAAQAALEGDSAADPNQGFASFARPSWSAGQARRAVI